MIKLEFLEIAYIVGVLTLFSVGINVLFETDAGPWLRRLNAKGRLYAYQKYGEKKPYQEWRLVRLLNDQIETVGSRRLFLIVTILSTSIVLFLGWITLTPILALSCAFFTGGVPWTALWLRKIIAGNKGSFEGESLVSLLLSYYRMENYNIVEALEAVVRDGKDIPFSSRQISRFLFCARQSAGVQQIEQASDQLAGGLNTNWGKMLASDIHIAATSGTNIALALEEILKQLREAGSLYEDRKRMNSETVRISLFMLPITYVITIWMSVKFMDMSLSTILFNQFRTPTGILMLAAILLLFFINWALIELVKHQKFDY